LRSGGRRGLAVFERGNDRCHDRGLGLLADWRGSGNGGARSRWGIGARLQWARCLRGGSRNGSLWDSGNE
jgi:hypothetical protein